MVYRIMDVNRDGETVARISSNNGKNALKKFRREHCISARIYEIRRGKFNWYMFSGFGIAFYALPENAKKVEFMQNGKMYSVTYENAESAFKDYEITKKYNKNVKIKRV